jgi:hypothetical protein
MYRYQNPLNGNIYVGKSLDAIREQFMKDSGLPPGGQLGYIAADGTVRQAEVLYTERAADIVRNVTAVLGIVATAAALIFGAGASGGSMLPLLVSVLRITGGALFATSAGVDVARMIGRMQSGQEVNVFEFGLTVGMALVSTLSGVGGFARVSAEVLRDTNKILYSVIKTEQVLNMAMLPSMGIEAVDVLINKNPEKALSVMMNLMMLGMFYKLGKFSEMKAGPQKEYVANLETYAKIDERFKRLPADTTDAAYVQRMLKLIDKVGPELKAKILKDTGIKIVDVAKKEQEALPTGRETFALTDARLTKTATTEVKIGSRTYTQMTETYSQNGILVQKKMLTRDGRPISAKELKENPELAKSIANDCQKNRVIYEGADFIRTSESINGYHSHPDPVPPIDDSFKAGLKKNDGRLTPEQVNMYKLSAEDIAYAQARGGKIEIAFPVQGGGSVKITFQVEVGTSGQAALKILEIKDLRGIVIYGKAEANPTVVQHMADTAKAILDNGWTSFANTTERAGKGLLLFSKADKVLQISFNPKTGEIEHIAISRKSGTQKQGLISEEFDSLFMILEKYGYKTDDRSYNTQMQLGADGKTNETINYTGRIRLNKFNPEGVAVEVLQQNVDAEGFTLNQEVAVTRSFGVKPGETVLEGKGFKVKPKDSEQGFDITYDEALRATGLKNPATAKQIEDAFLNNYNSDFYINGTGDIATATGEGCELWLNGRPNNSSKEPAGLLKIDKNILKELFPEMFSGDGVKPFKISAMEVIARFLKREHYWTDLSLRPSLV